MFKENRLIQFDLDEFGDLDGGVVVTDGNYVYHADSYAGAQELIDQIDTGALFEDPYDQNLDNYDTNRNIAILDISCVQKKLSVIRGEFNAKLNAVIDICFGGYSLIKDDPDMTDDTERGDLMIHDQHPQTMVDKLYRYYLRSVVHAVQVVAARQDLKLSNNEGTPSMYRVTRTHHDNSQKASLRVIFEPEESAEWFLCAYNDGEGNEDYKFINPAEDILKLFNFFLRKYNREEIKHAETIDV
jgi:hypothetical protein